MILVGVVTRRGRVELADQGGRALVDQSLELWDGDVRQRQVEDLVGLCAQRRKVPVEEDGVQDAANNIADRGGVGEGFEDELLRDGHVGGVVAAGIAGAGGCAHLIGLWSLDRELVCCGEEHVEGRVGGGESCGCCCCVCRQK